MQTFRSFALALTLALTPSAIFAQGTQTPIGGGGPRSDSIAVSGPLTLGSTIFVDDLGCPFTPGGMIALMIGLPLTPQSAQLQVVLPTTIIGNETCLVAVVPTIGVVDFDQVQRTIAFQLPTDPIFTTFDLGLQSVCFVCGFAGCFFDVSQALSIRIG